MYILGINAYHADASAALFHDGRLVGAVEEERLNRVKHAAGFPSLAIARVLEEAGVTAAQVDHVAISRDPRAHLRSKALFALRSGSRVARLVKSRLLNASRVAGVKESFCRATGLEPASCGATFHNVEHHLAHLSSSFFLSGWDQAACLSIDGFGDFSSTMMATGTRNTLQVHDRVSFPHSAGLFYTAVTQFIGFHKFGEEWKMMGLAPYGRPVFREQLSRLVRLLPGGKFELDLSYFTHHQEGGQMTWEEGSPHLGRVWSDRFTELLGPARDPDDPDFYGRWADLAASAQVVYEDIFFHVLNHLQASTGETRICLAGGCALNSVANGKITARTGFREVFVQPAAGDNGTSIGAAAHVAFSRLGLPRRERMEHAYTGPAFTDEQVEETLRATELPPGIGVTPVTDAELFQRVAKAIADGRVVGWFQGGMEFGPRALGNRSIVADPRRADMKDILNQRIKHRETYRPFAPSVLEEFAGEFFERSAESPFMLMVFPVKEAQRARIPCVTHVDHSARVQTVSRATNPRYHALISTFHALTGVPMVLNTSFNEHEPIVCTPKEALDCFLRTKMDVLAMGNILVERHAA